MLVPAMVLLGSIVVAALGTWRVKLNARRWGLIDLPNERSSHNAAVPRGGGLAIATVVIIATLVAIHIGDAPAGALLGLLVGSGAVAVVGLLDDRYTLSPWLRLVVHAGAATCVVIAVDVPWIARWAIVSFGAFWLIATTNIYNFMDGIDGLAATEGIFISGALLLLSHLSGGQHAIDAVLLAACGANMGFLYWNWPPARIFMGDVGSGFLGFVLGCCGLLLISEGVSTAAVLIVFAAFLVDSSITLVRRVLRRERWYSAHRTHAYQQLARAWGSHRSVTLVVAAINVFWLLPLAAWATILPETSARAIALAFGPLVFGCVAAGAGRALKFLG